MRHFQAEQEWVLHPGDMLYLPPNVPHYGVALNDCMTYSVGFRSPSQADMLEKLVEDLLQEPRLRQRFADPQRPHQAHPGELTQQDMDRLVDFLVDALPQDEYALQQWLGCYLTQPKHPILPDDEAPPPSRAELKRLLGQKKRFSKNLGARLLYFQTDNGIHLFANGKAYPVPLECREFIALLCHKPRINFSEYNQYLKKECQATLLQLLEDGILSTE